MSASIRCSSQLSHLCHQTCHCPLLIALPLLVLHLLLPQPHVFALASTFTNLLPLLFSHSHPLQNLPLPLNSHGLTSIHCTPSWSQRIWWGIWGVESNMSIPRTPCLPWYYDSVGFRWVWPNVVKEYGVCDIEYTQWHTVRDKTVCEIGGILITVYLRI